MLDQAVAWLEAYFARRPLPALPRLAGSGTPFERSVWAALARIPRGETVTYGAVAESIGSPRATRAVGRACGANPLPIFVPCHRVIGESGALTGFSSGMHRKIWLLAHEA